MDYNNSHSERSSEDVYWRYVERVGEEACAYAVLNYLDRETVVEIVLERIDADDLDEFLQDNLVESVDCASFNESKDDRQSGTTD